MLPKLILSALLLSCFLAPTVSADAGASGWQIFEKVRLAGYRGVNALEAGRAGLSGVFYNPALTASLGRRELFFVSELGAVEDKMGAVLYGVPVLGGVLLAGAAYYDAGPAELNWVENGTLVSRTVSLERDVLGIVSYGRAFSSKLAGGLSLKTAYSDVAEYRSAFAGALDAGIVFLPSRNLTLSAAVHNAGVATQFEAAGSPLPFLASAGFGYRLGIDERRFTVNAAGIYNVADATLNPEAGIEVGYGPVSLNAGYGFGTRDADLRVGFGVTLGETEFGYAFVPGTYLGPVHRMNLGWRFAPEEAAAPAGKPKAPPKRKKKSFLEQKQSGDSWYHRMSD